MLVVLAISSLGIIFDFDEHSKIEHYNPSGITHYDLPYAILPPSPRLLKLAFLDQIKYFPNRNTIVLIGNSVIAGAGAKDKLFLGSSLNNNFNVINAGLDGEYLSASSALAILGIDVNFKRDPSGFHHIFVAYPPSRLYAVSNYWVTGPTLITLAEERGLSSYITPYSITAIKYIKQGLLGIQNIIAGNMRCINNRNNVVNSITNLSITNLDFYCEKPFNIENNKPKFLKEYAGRMQTYTSQEYKALSEFMRDNTSIDNELQRESWINIIVEQAVPLERFLVQNGIRHKIYFLLLRDPPVAIDTLPSQRRDEYDLGKALFLKELAERMPSWGILEAPPMGNNDFFDAPHLRESGQAAIAAFIKQTIAQGQVIK